MLACGPDHLRDDVPGTLDDHDIAHADVLAADVVLVVQRRARDGHAADVDWLELGERVEDAGPSHADVDRDEPRDGGCGGPLVRASETRAAVQRPEPLLLREQVDLDHDPVDLVGEPRAQRLPCLADLRHLLDRLDTPRVRVRPEPALAEPREHLPLAPRGSAISWTPIPYT